MQIDWNAFTPLPALAGGALIGLSAAILVLGTGRVAGISGMLAGLLRPAPGELGWRLAFLAGLLITPLAFGALGALPPYRLAAHGPVLVTAGLLVGLGTRYGAGCTSGHGICGLARLSPRSIVATLCFMTTGFATVFVVRHVLGV